MIKRFWSDWPTGAGYAWGTSLDLRDEDLKYLGDNGWEMSIAIDLSLGRARGYPELGFWDSANHCIDAEKIAATFDYVYPLAEEYNIPFFVDLEVLMSCFPSYGAWCPLSSAAQGVSTDTVDDYEAWYGDALTVLNSYGPMLKGYCWEAGYDTGVEWINGKAAGTGKLLSQWLYHEWYWPQTPPQTLADRSYGNPPTHWATHDLAWRVAQVDEIVYELFSVDRVQMCIDMGTYVKSVGKPFGICMAFRDTAVDPTAWWANAGWWADTYYSYDPANPVPCPNLEEQKRRAMIYFNQIKEAIGPIDIINPLGALVTYVGEYAPVCDLLDTLNLGGLGTHGAQKMKETGLSPGYLGVTPCTHDPPLTSTFDNTGNELILLKNYVDNCGVHTITVTSTDTLTHEDYTLTCLPERGTIIGPYPLDTYGAVPTIEYDNTNLYVSILKVRASA